MALIRNNARVASQIAVELSRLKGDKRLTPSTQNNNGVGEKAKMANAPVVVGGSIVDVSYSVIEDDLQVRESNKNQDK